jgi:hypothetical protein
MIHERKLDKQLHINGPLTTCVATVTAALHEIEASIAIQNEGFENLIRGSTVPSGRTRSTLENLCNKPERLRLVGLDIPVAGRAAEDLIHLHF